jgi:tetratricopeptide (TPR) repeat protein
MSFVILGLTLLLFQTSPETAEFDSLAKLAAAALDRKPEEAVALYRQALGIRPAWAEGWLYLGASLYQLQRYPESRDALKQGVSLASQKGTPWAFLGLCEYELGEYGQALEHILKSEAIGLADNPGFVASVRHHGALLYLRRADFRQAVEQIRPLATVAADAPAPLIEALGMGVLGMTLPPSGVLEDKRALVDLAGRAAWAFYAQRPEEASTAFQKLVEQYPNEPGVHYANGIFLLDRAPEAALAEFQMELRFSPTHVLARQQIVFLEIKAGQSETALETAWQAVKLDPADFLSQVALGRAFLSMGQTVQSIPALETAVKLAPENPQTHFYLEQAYRRAGRNSDARKEKAEFTRLRSAQDPLTLPPIGAAR